MAGPVARAFDLAAVVSRARADSTRSAAAFGDREWELSGAARKLAGELATAVAQTLVLGVEPACGLGPRGFSGGRRLALTRVWGIASARVGAGPVDYGHCVLAPDLERCLDMIRGILSRMDGTADGRTPVEVGDPEGAEHRIAHQTTKVGHSSKMDTADALIEQQVQARLFSRDVTTRIGRYRVVEHIGHGGMGRVYAAMDEELDRKVAVKVLLDDDLPSESIRLRFRREAQALARLSHPHVVTVYEVGETRDGQLFLAMEFIRGQSLDAWLKTEPGWRDVLDAFIQGGEGLAAAHHADLVHRDLKPSNLMRSEDGVVKVLDFGLARIDSEEPSYPAGDYQLSDHSGSHPTSPTSPLTRPGAIMGTPAYMSPEQLAGTFVDAASDQYSFCVSLFEALYGERPTVYDSTDDLQESVRRKAAASSNGLPSLLSAAVLRGLEPDPADRWPSMEALLVELRKPLAPRTRSKIAIVASVVTLGLGGSWAFGQYMQVKDRCTGAEAKLVGVWDEQRRGEVKAALVGTELVYASSTWERVESRLDEHARAWVEHHTEACEATAVRKEQSAKTLELRMGCLQDQVTELRAAVEVLAD